MTDIITSIPKPYVGLTYHKTSHPDWRPEMVAGFKFFGTKVVDGKLMECWIKEYL